MSRCTPTQPERAHDPEAVEFLRLFRAATPEAQEAMTAALSLAVRDTFPLTPEAQESHRETLRRFTEARGGCPPLLAELLRSGGEPA